MEVLNKQWRYILNVLILVLCMTMMFMFSKSTSYESSFNYLMEDDFQGRVIEKYIDYDNHAERTLVFENYEKSVWTELYGIIEIGDSISKNRNDSLYYVYKQNDTIIYNGVLDIKE